ncbi:MAG: hypothetical protein GX680_07985 [Bacteroidales bacterium]|nr:hypothetical protein [Bacteroidales bacterium]
MRIKRTVVSFFLFLAGIVLLAHTFLPHHHHDHISIVYFSGNISHDNCCNTSNCEIADNDCQDSNKDCMDANIMLRAGDDTREELIAATNDLIPLLLFLSADNTDASIENTTRHSIYKTYSLPCYLDYLTDSQGLRAPPVC